MMQREMTMEQALGLYVERAERMDLMNRKTIRWIVLYDDGRVSRETQAVEYLNVLFNIPIHPLYQNKQGRLLLCYDNGRVNVLDIKEIFKDKLKAKGFKKNGYCMKDDRKLVRAFVCDKDDYLVICSIDANGKKYIKADLIDKRNATPNMRNEGNIFVKDARPYRWMVFPGALKKWLKPVIVPTGTNRGVPLESYALYPQLVELFRLAEDLNSPPIVCVH